IDRLATLQSQCGEHASQSVSPSVAGLTLHCPGPAHNSQKHPTNSMPRILQSLSDKLDVFLAKFRARTLHPVALPPEVEYVPVSRRDSLLQVEGRPSGGEAAANKAGSPKAGTGSVSVSAVPSNSNSPRKSNSSATALMPTSVPSHPRSIAVASKSRNASPQHLPPPRSLATSTARPASAALHSSPAGPRPVPVSGSGSRRDRKLSQSSQRSLHSEVSTGERPATWHAVEGNNGGVGIVSGLR
ncbi:hypothetical protein M427DRAFT_290118, partial [Gonapodya prolifera JEL478]